VVASWFKFVDAERHGFGVLEVTGDHVHQDFFFISDRTDPQATLVDGPSFRSLAGSDKLTPAAQLGPRPAPTVTAPPTTVTPPTTAGGGSIPATGRAVPVGAAAGAVAVGLAAAAAARRTAPPSEEHT
jgi:hypothetical protein